MKYYFLYPGLIFFLILFPANQLFSQPSITVREISTPPVIDGRVDDIAWKEASVINELYQREPKTGEPVSEKTEFLFMYDRNNIYVAFKCYDNPSLITAKELARDVSLGDDDRVQVIFDTFLDGRNGYWFQIGPRGSIGDALVGENGKDFNKSWDGLWDGKARITEEGWEAEIAIPFKTLSFKKGGETWGLKIIRHIRRKSESSYWPATSLNLDKFALSDAGRISGLKGITQGIGLDLVPYLTTGLSREKDKKADPVLDGGLDAFYQVTPSIKIAGTVNTDFAQTEVDERQINLTRFSLFFPEKRDFFLDGSNYFTFGINGDRENSQGTQMVPFFSRRIGLDDDGVPVNIKYGGKITGKAGRVNFGLLHVNDDDTLNNPGYTVGRVSYNFGKQSSVGIIGTTGNSFSDNGNSVAGIDLRLAKPDFGGNKTVVLNFYGLRSFTDGINGKDYSFGAEINYPNDFLSFRLGYLQTGENFTAGIGFVPRKNISDIYGSLFIGPRPKNSPVLQVKSGMDYVIISDLTTGKIQSAEVGLDFIRLIMLSGDEFSFFTDYNYESLDKGFNIFKSITINPGDYNFWRNKIVFSTAKRRKLWASTRVVFGSFYSGKRTDLVLQAGYKIGVPVFAGLESDRKWVDLAEGSFVAQIYRFNLNILFGPNATWYNYAQYDSQTGLAGWQSRFQWIIKPGKEIFLTLNSPAIDPMERFSTTPYEGRLKVKYTIRF